MNLIKLALYYGSQKNNLSFSILRSGEREHMLKEPSGKSLRLYARRLMAHIPTRRHSCSVHWLVNQEAATLMADRSHSSIRAHRHNAWAVNPDLSTYWIWRPC
jgi:hypothetical protein